ncbi:helix-turn-helix transcriptional regulator [Staphylococcus sp. Marseille-Q6910]|uniref:helix-turn-helix domain-containing protein n=1 Tax=Staphylococcus sp. Marseille-Q6910 TaxID=2937990 RepID=UPI00333D22FC
MIAKQTILAKNIKDIRQSLGLSMEEFGKKFKVNAHKSLVSKWEKGLTKPNNERIQKIAELGNVSVDYLLHGLDDKTLKVGKEFYNHLIEMYPHNTHDGKALRFFDVNKRNDLIIRGINAVFNDPLYSEEVHTIDDIDGLFNYCWPMLNIFVNEYEREHISNPNLIHSIRRKVLQILRDLEKYDSEKKIMTIEPNTNKFPELSDSIINVNAINNLDPNLLKDMHDLFTNLYRILDKYEMKYPDLDTLKDYPQFYEIRENNTKKLFTNDLIKTIQLSKSQDIESFITKNIDDILREYQTNRKE